MSITEFVALLIQIIDSDEFPRRVDKSFLKDWLNNYLTESEQMK